MIFGLMVGVGCSLHKEDMLDALKSPKPIVIGLVLQYLSMPLLALAITNFLNFDHLSAYILLLIACCPGGTTSNMFTYFAKGNVSLSILLTTITSIFAIIMTPTLLKLFGQNIGLQIDHLKIPMKNIVGTLGFSLIPIIVGFTIRSKNQLLAQKVEKWGNKIGHVSILLMILIWLPKTFQFVKAKESSLFIGIACLSLIGMLVGFIVSTLTKIDQVESRTLSFETGIQNAPLAFAIVSLSYSENILAQISWIPLLYGALSVGNAIIMVLIYKFAITRPQHRNINFSKT